MKWLSYFSAANKRQRAADLRRISYRDGYGWAWASYRLENLSPIEIEAKIYGSNHPFDQGANEALIDILKSDL